ncbi:MAG: purine-nucleoside phosphorylase, partial [Desulfosalsimonas sp.]
MQARQQNKDFYWQQVREAAADVKDCIGVSGAAMGIITGTGLSGSMVDMATKAEIPYDRIPHFPASTVQGHAGRLVFGQIHGRRVFVMQGRFHLYEGYSAPVVCFPVRLMQALGVKTLMVTNAAGGLCTDFSAGDIMAISDHINLTGENPLVGPNNEDWGIRFPDMSAVYDAGLMDCAMQAAQKSGINLHKGVYAGLKGPSLETPAELRFLRQIGADAAGLSTVM